MGRGKVNRKVQRGSEVRRLGCWILDAGSAGVLEKTVSAWKDAGYWMLVVPVFLKRRFRLGRMLDAEASAGHNNTGTTSLNLNVER